MAARYRLYPKSDQAEVLTRHCADTRFVWNLALEQFNQFDKRVVGRQSPNFAEVARQLKDARGESFLSEGSSSIQQQALRGFQNSAGNWFKGTHRRPRFHKRGVHESFCIRDVRIKRLSGKWAAVHVPKCGYVRFRLSRHLPPEFGMGRVTLDSAGRWHVAFSAPQPAVECAATGASVGIDLGIAATITTSDGDQIAVPQPSRRECQRRLRLERKLARQVRGSNRRATTKLKLAKVRARQTDRIKDWREKTSTQLIRDFDLIVFEDLKTKNMMRSAKGSIEAPGKNVRAKAGLNRQIAAQGWAALVLRTEQKAAASGASVVRVSPINASRRCGVCGFTTAENRKSQAVFNCQECGHIEHADINAAKNILAAGLAVSGRGGEIRPPVTSVFGGAPGEASTELQDALCAV